MICFTTYENHDVDEDPVIILPCKHFYATSTLDGHLSMQQVYETENGVFVAVKPLSEATGVTEKPRTCPDCRSLIHSIRRYGRILRFAELRSLERKHIISNDRVLKYLENAPERTKNDSIELVKKLKNLELKLLTSPMHKVYDACASAAEKDVFDEHILKPPAQLILRTRGLLASKYSNLAEMRVDDDNFTKAIETFNRAIDMAETSRSTRSAAVLRLQLCGHLAKFFPIPEPVKREVLGLLEVVLSLGEIFPDVAAEAKKIKENIMDRRKEIAEVLAVMNRVDGHDYGASWSSHWFQCPNGHPYFIGECGGAMQEARCIECGAAIGGSGHRLHSDNSRAGGLVAEAMREGAGR